MDVQFVAGVSPIVRDAAEARRFYGARLGLPVKPYGDTDYSTVELAGLKHFGLWTLRDAARSTFGKDDWPDSVPAPTVTIELEVDNVGAAVEELKARGLDVVQEPRIEEWGQTTARLLSPEGVLIGIVYTPWLREQEA